ncbi:VOC family protein [Kocuria sp. JC486]|uniref:VOC family protein n=1 Tax=Kocuria sp. JC486 TaxID=1970736 RepID=UPI00142349FC|nr:VOC family protein [Kocuria sp. JC486]NHU86143.1 VOC family protein [Kocuria sp. JC486]
MTRVAPLASISIDCPQPSALAPFYCQLLGLQQAFASPDKGVISLAGPEPGPVVTLMKVSHYQAPEWPEGPQLQQMHLDLASEDLDQDVAAAIAIGARQADHQPSPDQWRVMLDPVGHPFCLSVVRAD